jgi:hypothetical protein
MHYVVAHDESEFGFPLCGCFLHGVLVGEPFCAVVARQSDMVFS